MEFPIEGWLAYSLFLLFISWLAARYGVKRFKPPAALRTAARCFRKFAGNKTMAICSIFLISIVARLLLLLLTGHIPRPHIPDEFCYILGADTFLHGRLANPSHPLHRFFVTKFVLQTPTYMPKFFPGQFIVLALGKFFFGHYWYGVLLSNALMCALTCWMLQGWLPATWALLGGILSIMNVGLFTIWGESYFGGSMIAAGGALVFGALGRLRRHITANQGMLLALGLAITLINRPYETVAVMLPIVAWYFYQGATAPKPRRTALIRSVLFPAAVSVAIICLFLACYFWAVTGNPLSTPYMLYHKQVQWNALWIWQPPDPDVQHREPWQLSDVYITEFNDRLASMKTWPGFINLTIHNAISFSFFFFGPSLLPSLLGFPQTIQDRKLRLVWVCLVSNVVATLSFIYFNLHYFAIVFSAIYLICLQSFRHINHWKCFGQPTGRFLVGSAVVFTFIGCLMGVFVKASSMKSPTIPEFSRTGIEMQLEKLPGKHLVIVHFPDSYRNGWYGVVYNEADIDQSKIVWARDLGPEDDKKLIAYFKHRTIWWVDFSRYPSAAVSG